MKAAPPWPLPPPRPPQPPSHTPHNPPTPPPLLPWFLIYSIDPHLQPVNHWSITNLSNKGQWYTTPLECRLASTVIRWYVMVTALKGPLPPTLTCSLPPPHPLPHLPSPPTTISNLLHNPCLHPPNHWSMTNLSNKGTTPPFEDVG